MPGAEDRFLGGYAPLVLALVVVAGLVVALPSTRPQTTRTALAQVGEEGRPASGWGEGVSACPDEQMQIAGDPYSPPCFAFAGDNGGATSKGVTAEEIVVTHRITPEASTLGLLAALMGIELPDTSDDIVRTTQGLLDHFNDTFQFYGRRLTLQTFEGKGSLAEELTGGGQAHATNDGLQAGQELASFADVSAVTQPYAEGLARHGTVAFGAPYLSREWFTERRPYAWSMTTDCSVVAETTSTYALRRLIGEPAAHAGGALADRPRRLAVISPSNPEYQRCTAAGLATIEDGGEQVDLVTDYVLDLARIPNQAASISAQLVDRAVTTIACFCDPFMVLNLTEQLSSQGVHPEWIVTGTGFSDLDLIGQGLQSRSDQWEGSFGLSPTAEQAPIEESPGYRAFKSVRPDEEPAQTVDLLYHQLYQLALGVQMAGPELTPSNLEAGLFAYPGASGPAGTWDYEPERYTPVIDAREVWWDPEKISPFNGRPGSYRSAGGRYLPDEIPVGQPRPPEELRR